MGNKMTIKYFYDFSVKLEPKMMTGKICSLNLFGDWFFCEFLEMK
jgi:hypothetical protein